jgi:tRNA-dihydrouridine synthase A
MTTCYPHPISIAPMMDYTDKHFRYLLRLISKRVLLYTEMVTADAILYGPRDRLLSYNPQEHPLALQLGGSDPQSLSTCSKLAEDLGYDEINLNVGCPSPRVQKGRFGACLMKEPDLVAECITAMQAQVKIPVTIKTRIGVDDLDSYEDLVNFINKTSNAGCKTYIMHARKAWLKGLSPKENRSVPPLRYETVYQLKDDFPQLNIVLNGGVQTIEQIEHNLQKLDGVMIGRQVVQDPYLLAVVDCLFYNEPTPIPTREQILSEYITYMKQQLEQGIAITSLTRHLLGLYCGMPGARKWRRELTENPGIILSFYK